MFNIFQLIDNTILMHDMHLITISEVTVQLMSKFVTCYIISHVSFDFARDTRLLSPVKKCYAIHAF